MQAQPSNTTPWYAADKTLSVTLFAAHAVCACAQHEWSDSSGPSLVPLPLPLFYFCIALPPSPVSLLAMPL